MSPFVGIQDLGRKDRLLDRTLNPDQLAVELRKSVTTLAGEIGVRHIWLLDRLRAAEDWIRGEFERFGYSTRRESFLARGIDVGNLVVEVRGSKLPEEIIVIGAHYDSRTGMRHWHGREPDHSYPGTPGANDNGSGVAATLALARVFAERSPARTLRFIAFVNEEPPFFTTPEMGSWVHAKGCRERSENIVGMFTPETLGYFVDVPRSQKLAPVFGREPGSPGDFIAFLSDWRSRRFLDRMLQCFRAWTPFPVVGVPVPRVSSRVAWSDDWSFWKHGFPGVAITDTAFLRYRYYHTPEDTPEKLDYLAMARVVGGLAGMLADLAE